MGHLKIDELLKYAEIHYNYNNPQYYKLSNYNPCCIIILKYNKNITEDPGTS